MADQSEYAVVGCRQIGAVVGALVVAFVSATPLRAQNIDSVQTARAEEVLARVRRYSAGDVQTARTLVDSLVRGLPRDATMMPEALFAKASIAGSAADAEQDYARIVTEYRFAARVPDALMRLAILESARNNRVLALRHLDRLLRDHPDAPVRSRASLMAGNMRMAMNDPARACDLLAAAYASAGPNERDVISQAQTAGATCPTSIVAMAEREPPPLGIMRAPRAGASAAGVSAPPRRTPTRASGSAVSVATDAPAPVRQPVPSSASSPVPPSVRQPVQSSAPTPVQPTVRQPVQSSTPNVARDVVPANGPRAVRQDVAPVVAVPASPARTEPAAAVAASPVVAAPASPARTEPAAVVAASPAAQRRYGVQFAAYNDRPGAEQLAGVLQERGISARVEGTTAPFRVRAGRFTTRAEAEAAAMLWRRGGQAVMIVPLGPTP